MDRARASLDQGDVATAAVELRNVVQADGRNAGARRLLGHASQVLGDFDTAEIQYAQLLELGNDDAETWYGLGLALVANGKAVEAMERVVPNLEPLASSDRHFVLLGDTLIALGNTDAALEYYNEALQIDPVSAGGQVGRAAIAAFNGNTESALQIVNNALSSNPNSALLLRAKGNLLQSLDQHVSAAEAFALSIENQTRETPRAEQFQSRAGRLSSLIDAGRYDEADSDLAALRRMFPSHPMLSFLRGRIAFGRGDYAAAQTEFQNFLATSPDDAHGQAMLGAANFRQTNYGQAEMWLTRAARANVGGDAIRRLLGETKLRLHKPGEALEALRAAQSAGQADAFVLAMIGRAEIGVGNTEAAIEAFEQSLEEDPDNAMTSIALAASYIQAGRIKDGTDLLDSLPAGQTGQHFKDTLLVSAYLRSGESDRAIREAQRVLDDNPDDPLAWALAGLTWQTLGDLAQARTHFERVIQLDANNVAGTFSLGRLDIADGDLVSALARFNRVLDIDPSFLPALHALVVTASQTGLAADISGRIAASIEAVPQAFLPRGLRVRLAIAEGRDKDAMTGVEEVAQMFPGDARVDHLRGLVLLRTGKAGEAIRSMTRAVAADSENVEFLFDLANAQLNNGDSEGAMQTAGRFVALQPGDVRGLSLLTASATRAGKAGNARAPVQAYLDDDPQNPVAMILLGDIDLASGNPAAALNSYEAAAAIEWTRQVAMKLAFARQGAGMTNSPSALSRWLDEHPDDHEMRNLYAQMLEADGATEQAISEYERLLEIGEASATALNNLAWQYSLQGRPEALDIARRASAAAPDNGDIADTLGWILLQQDNVDEALPILRRAVAQSGNNVEVQYHLAVALFRSGNATESKQILTRILQSNATFPSRADAERLAAEI